MDVQQFLTNLVCRNHLLAFLDVNDLLRLRRVCKTFKDEADDFIRTKKVKTKREIKIDFLNKHKAFNDFNRVQQSLINLPITTRASFSFRLTLYSDLISVPLQQFLDSYGPSITHLTIARLMVPFYSDDGVQKFFDSFPNIKHLAMEELETHSLSQKETEWFPVSSADRQEISLLCLKNLKTLRFSCMTFLLFDEPLSIRSGLSFIIKLVETCLPSLEQLEFPFSRVRGRYMEEVMYLVRLCFFTSPNLKLVNVDGEFIEKLLTPEMGSLRDMIDRINNKVISIRNPLNASFLQELPNLTRIDFCSVKECSIPEPGHFVMWPWPKLNEIIVRFNENSAVGNNLGPLSTKVWDFLFGCEIRRESVVKLEITHDGYVEEERKQLVPRTLGLMTSCPNVKILHIRFNIKQLVSVQKLWNGLPRLEELVMDNCHDLEDFDFVGYNPQNPVFWNLKRLTVLEIREINETALTDDLLSIVICHMPLKKLVLASSYGCSQQPSHSISLEGIKSLLGGKFASTIERLDIEHLNLGPGATIEKKELEGIFRSSQMI